MRRFRREGSRYGLVRMRAETDSMRMLNMAVTKLDNGLLIPLRGFKSLPRPDKRKAFEKIVVKLPLLKKLKQEEARYRKA